jgi:nitroreductase
MPMTGPANRSGGTTSCICKSALLMLLTAVDAGLGACFFGIPVERIDAYRAAFGVPAQFTPIGAISVGYSDEPPRDLSSRRKPEAETVHRGRWTKSAR